MINSLFAQFKSLFPDERNRSAHTRLLFQKIHSDIRGSVPTSFWLRPPRVNIQQEDINKLLSGENNLSQYTNKLLQRKQFVNRINKDVVQNIIKKNLQDELAGMKKKRRQEQRAIKLFSSTYPKGSNKAEQSVRRVAMLVKDIPTTPLSEKQLQDRYFRLRTQSLGKRLQDLKKK